MTQADRPFVLAWPILAIPTPHSDANEGVSPTVAELWMRFRNSGGDAAWEALVGALTPVFRRVVSRVARRYYATRSDVEDAFQESMLKLTARRDHLAAEGCVEGYFKALAANATHDYFRSQRASRRDQRRDVSLDALEFQLIRDSAQTVDRALLIRQIDGFLPADGRDRAVFWLYYRQGFTAREIASIPAFALTVKGVESLIFRLTNLVRDKVQSRPGELADAGASS